ncbi:probable calcium-binding protein CML41 [Rhodamnia argentea]|uniref:Probable calcium-binding protein CML41 n=1 Tax=Rhodamnia argentea TaxID=178133 RepID=A0A8B8P4C8_9MYRT|nr:probable calcium-binding protein CML41 [Rhodamnia argentea]
MANGGSAPSPKPFKWLNKSLRLTFPRRSSHSKSSSSNLSTPSSPTSTSTDREHELREVFRRFDADGDGKISALELRAYFASIGEYMSHEEARSVVGELDTDGDCLIDFGDFLKLMKMDSGGDDSDLRRAFEMFEDEKGSGSITPKGLQAMLRRLGDAKSYEECEDMIRVYDIDGNGVLDFQEFHQMMA